MIVALALGVSAIGFSSASVAADEGHDHEAMVKAEKKISTSFASLSPQDQKLAAAQRFCPIRTSDRLGAMGSPVKVMIEGKPIFLCCKGCVKGAVAGGAKTVKTAEKLLASTATLAKVEQLKKAGTHKGHDHKH